MLAAFLSSPTLQAQSPGDKDYFETYVRPVLVKNCIHCHGPAKQESGLDLTTLDAMLRGGDSGAALVQGDSTQSLLMSAIRHESLQMPPDKKLEESEIDHLAQWISKGAIWPQGEVLRAVSKVTEEDRKWWCLQPIAKAALPTVTQEDWCRNEIDFFILQKLEAEGLGPTPVATTDHLQRRAHFALTGLPPKFKPGLISQSEDPNWYERMIDQLLEEKSYGENQARYWLDLVRYADSDGYRADALRPAAAQYKKYVIDSFNDDKPYDRFIVEQLAGDEVDPNNRESIVATMYLRHWIYEHNQRDVEGQWQEILDDVTETTADAFLALGLKCARCHDHKYDPLLQKDFFRMQAFFAALHPREDLPVATIEARQEYNEKLQAWEQATQEIRLAIYALENPTLLTKATREGFEKFVPEIKAMILKQPYARTPHEHQIATLAQRQYDVHPEKLPEWLDKETEAKRQQLLAELAKLDNLKPAPLPTQPFVATDVGPVPPPTWIIGDREKVEIEPGPPTIIDEQPTRIEPPHPALKSTGRRTALAKWIASPTNPLTARVIVNRIWEQHFGTGLAENASDFGRLGELPTHPELLDWLANRFIEDGWSIKRLHRLILTSATYRQSSLGSNPTAMRKDPSNRLLWRMNPRRLSGEEIVDAMLFASAELNQGEVKRAVFEKVMRNNLPAVAGLFDFPDRNESVSKRHRTTTSTQALMLMNNPWVMQRARKLLTSLAQYDSAEFVAVAFQRVFGREAESEEIAEALEFMKNYAMRSPEPETLEDSTKVAVAEDPSKSPAAADPPDPNEPIVGASGKGKPKESADKKADKSKPKEEVEPPLSPQDQARMALLHTLLDSNELIYID
jgi:mono/diheme cytochrome c family protein